MDLNTFSTNTTTTKTRKYAGSNIERKTKIMVTISEECFDINSLSAMIDSGMNIARFHFTSKNFDLQEFMLRNLIKSLEKSKD